MIEISRVMSNQSNEEFFGETTPAVEFTHYDIQPTTTENSASSEVAS